MKTRIEVWIDADVPKDRIEEFRKHIEDCNWAAVRTWHNVALVNFVQANEVPIPLPSHGTREDYVEYKESQARCTST